MIKNTIPFLHDILYTYLHAIGIYLRFFCKICKNWPLFYIFNPLLIFDVSGGNNRLNKNIPSLLS